MLMDIADDTTNMEADINKIFDNSIPPATYSLSQALHETENELTVLGKKINLGNDLLVKVNDPVLISKLKKHKEESETKKNNLIILIKKLKLITNSIKDFTLFFIFIRRFYTLAIQKENFENAGKKISSKLIANLKSEEEKLYNEYIEGNCFSKVRLALSFEPYESYFEEYAKNFFENIRLSSDLYVNTLLMLKAVFYECMYFRTDNFNLTDIQFFLSQNIPIDIPLPKTNYELVVLRCFFYYYLLSKFLKLKPIENNVKHLKKAVTLELNIVNYKADAKDSLLICLNDLQETLHKLDKKHNEFLEREAIEDKEADVNHALIFYKILEGEIQAINKKNKTLIDNKYVKLEKMRRLLVVIVNESHLPKFLEVFNAKIGNDFLLNAIRKPELVETNKEALNYLFHAICRDEFYTPLNQKINSFINAQIGTYSKEDASILDNIEFKDLIEFSFYYLFTLIYTDFNGRLAGFNNKLLYAEMIAFNVFIDCKLQSLQVLEEMKNARIKKFIEKNFKNIDEYKQHKKNILEEIKLNLETIRDIKHIFSDTITLETSLLPKLVTSLVPMPEKNFLVDSLKFLEKKQKICELAYQKIEKHKFINKSKPEKVSKINEVQYTESLEIDCNSIDSFSETLCCLSVNLTESISRSNQSINEEVEKNPARKLSEEQSEQFESSKEKSSRTQDANDVELSLITEVLKSTDECNKIRTRFEGEYANKERAKADLKAITSANRYNFLISRIDPLDVDKPITIKNADNNHQTEPTFCSNAPTSLQMDTLETNLYNHSQSGSAIYTTPAPTMLFPVPPTIVVDTYRLESRTVFYPVTPDRA